MAMQAAVYRGSLKSCNYSCTYCPFSKHGMYKAELEKDKRQWFSFIQSYCRQAGKKGIRALMVAPYGEALIHPWYWEGLAQASALSWTDAVGAQTNLGFPLGKMSRIFQSAGGVAAKLKLWATFHPQMVSVEEFVRQCARLADMGVGLSVGAVGVPENIQLLKYLKSRLPTGIYMWINKMDGIGRPYAPGEVQAFLEIDPYFYRELMPVAADASQCQGRLFAEAGGRRRLCNISAAIDGGWEGFFEAGSGQNSQPLSCGRKQCTCYLAYGGRENLQNRMLFGPYPLFRIPRRPKAVFLDIEGTLLPKQGQGCRGAKIDPGLQAGLEALSKEGTALFFATTLPYKEARERCRKFWHLFHGGIFAGGAHAVWEKEGRKEEFFYYLEEECLPCLLYLDKMKSKFHFRIMEYKNGGRHYKITLLRPQHMAWGIQEAEEVARLLLDTAKGKVRYFTEGNCMQIVSARADKAAGVMLACKWLGISPKEAFAQGDSAQDARMMEICGEANA